MMNKTIKFIVIITFVFMIIIASYWLGVNSAKTIAPTPTNFEHRYNFYATIKSINNNNILVKGLDINDINYRGEFSLTIKDSTDLKWRSTDINITDLKNEDIVSVTFSGAVLESYPAQIPNVTYLQLLNDFIDLKEVEFTQTFNIVSDLRKIDTSGTYNYYVVDQFQKDNPTVIKMNKSFNIEQNKNYEITFRGAKSKYYAEYSILEIFNDFEVQSVNLTNKVGLDQIQDNI